VKKSNRQQATGNRQQHGGGRQQATGNGQQDGSDRQQATATAAVAVEARNPQSEIHNPQSEIRNVCDLGDDEIRSLPHRELAALCRTLNQKADGGREELIKRLLAVKRGGDRHHVHGKTLCPLGCGSFARVRSVQGGQRYMQCLNPSCNYRFTRSAGN
jgi:hypothetical protein